MLLKQIVTQDAGIKVSTSYNLFSVVRMIYLKMDLRAKIHLYRENDMSNCRDNVTILNSNINIPNNAALKYIKQFLII